MFRLKGVFMGPYNTLSKPYYLCLRCLLFDTGFSYAAGIICMVFGIIAILWEKFVNNGSIVEGIKSLDWETTLFLAGIFILVGGIILTGWIEVISGFLSGLIGENIFLGYTLVVFISVLLSAFIDNVPFLAAMLPVAVSMSNKLGINPSLFLFGLLIGTSLGEYYSYRERRQTLLPAAC